MRPATTTMRTVTMQEDHPFVVVAAAAAAEIAFAIAFVIASLLQKLSYSSELVCAFRHMGLVHPDVDMTHVFVMRLYCVKHANKHYMHTYIVLNEKEMNGSVLFLLFFLQFQWILTEHFDVFQDERVNCTDY